MTTHSSPHLVRRTTVQAPTVGQRVAARPWLWLPAPGTSAAGTLAPYYCPATVTGVLVDVVELDFDQPQAQVWPRRQMAAPSDLHPWPHHCRDCRATATPVDPVAELDGLRRRLAATEDERDALAAELYALRTGLSRTA